MTNDVPRCYQCGNAADDTCPLCGKSVCRRCAEREGEFCCEGNDDGRCDRKGDVPTVRWTFAGAID